MEQINTTRSSSAPPRENGSIIDLLKHLARESTALVRTEIELARAEISDKVSQAESGITSMAAGGVITFAGAILLLMAVALYLNLFLSAAWLSFLIIGGVTALIGVAMLAKGRSNVKVENLAPRRTRSSLQDDKDLAGKHLNPSGEKRSDGNVGRAHA